MKRLSSSKIVFGLVVLTGALVTVGNGCSRFLNGSSGSNNSAAVAPTPEDNGGYDDGDYIPGTKAVQIVYGKQILDHYSSCLGLIKPSDRTIATHQRNMSSVSVNGHVKEMTGPMMISVISIVADLCDDLITQDIANPRMFVGFNQSSTSLPSDKDILDAAGRLSISCWNRSVESIERNTVLDMVKDSITNGEANATRKAALMACTSMLSATDGVIR